MSKLEVREIAPISGETDLTLGQSGGTVTLATGSIGSTHELAFQTKGTERMRIDSNGNLKFAQNTTGVPGFENTTAGFSIFGSGLSNPGRVFVSQDLFSSWNSNTEGAVISWRHQGTAVGSVAVTNTSTTYNTSSDYRLKEDWQPMSGSIDRVKALKPVNFAWKVDGSRADGFLAHEVQEVVSEAIVGTKDGMRSEEYEITPALFNDEGVETTSAVMGTREVPEYQGIDHSKLVPLLTSALQEAIAKIESLEERVAALEAN